jgi:hypothetical protein
MQAYTLWSELVRLLFQLRYSIDIRPLFFWCFSLLQVVPPVQRFHYLWPNSPILECAWGAVHDIDKDFVDEMLQLDAEVRQLEPLVIKCGEVIVAHAAPPLDMREVLNAPHDMDFWDLIRVPVLYAVLWADPLRVSKDSREASIGTPVYLWRLERADRCLGHSAAWWGPG